MYSLRAVPAGDSISLHSFTAGSQSLITSAGVVLDDNVLHSYEIECIGDNIICSVDGVELINVTDATIATGTYAGFSRRNNTTEFDNFLVTDPNFVPPENVIPPYSGAYGNGIAQYVGAYSGELTDSPGTVTPDFNQDDFNSNDFA